MQKKGTAMGTSFSATYAAIFNDTVGNTHNRPITHCTGYIDDILLIWAGSSVEPWLSEQCLKPPTPPTSILCWKGKVQRQASMQPIWFLLVHHQLRGVDFLDLDFRFVRSHGSDPQKKRSESTTNQVMPTLFSRMDPTTRDTLFGSRPRRIEQPLGLAEGMP